MGRPAWDGSEAFCQTQIKQMMAANIDVITVEVLLGKPQDRDANQPIPGTLRPSRQGYNVPKVAAVPRSGACRRRWLDGSFEYSIEPVDLSTTAGKDDFVKEISDFYNEYYSVNTDAYADNYIAQLGGRRGFSTCQLSTSPSGMTKRHEYLLVDSRGRAESPRQRSRRTACPFQQPPCQRHFHDRSRRGITSAFEDERLSSLRATSVLLEGRSP